MKVGSLVELVNDVWNNRDYSEEIYPVKGIIYTIRDLFECDGLPCLTLEEIVNKKMQYSEGNYEMAFNPDRFRELQPPMKISIEQFLKVKI